jgi:hypothetical protein
MGPVETPPGMEGGDKGEWWSGDLTDDILQELL